MKVEHCCSDNVGTCTLVISDKGVAYFSGVNKKGEAGEPGNISVSPNLSPLLLVLHHSRVLLLAARAPKPTKLKRIAKVKDSHIVSGACGGNNCCLICKEGKVFMFGPTEGDIVDKNTGRLEGIELQMDCLLVCTRDEMGSLFSW